jgi:hypothetical protein
MPTPGVTMRDGGGVTKNDEGGSLTLPVHSPKTNGFAERFIRTLKEEFVGIAFRKKIYTSLDELQEELDNWLQHYNYERPHRGYRNMGKRPIDTVQSFIKDK